jgi:hypothetical protein
VDGLAYLKWVPIEKERLRLLKRNNVMKPSFKMYIDTIISFWFYFFFAIWYTINPIIRSKMSKANIKLILKKKLSLYPIRFIELETLIEG